MTALGEVAGCRRGCGGISPMAISGELRLVD
jgi:hypothetical protein